MLLLRMLHKHSWKCIVAYLRESLRRKKKRVNILLWKYAYIVFQFSPCVKWRTSPEIRRANPITIQCFSLAAWPWSSKICQSSEARSRFKPSIYMLKTTKLTLIYTSTCPKWTPMMVERTADIELQVMRLKSTYPVRHFLKMRVQHKRQCAFNLDFFYRGMGDPHMKFPWN